jgi:tripartite-type tricarboxylate transporter receptor subunit TctC
MLQGETIRWIVPYSAGGGYDVYSRLLEPFLEEALGVEIVVENRTGATGLLGSRALQSAPPDGRTLGMVNGAALLTQQLLDPDAGLHPTEDFTPLGRMSQVVAVLFTRQDGPYADMESLMRAGQDGGVVFTTSGVASTSWLWIVIATELLGMDVPYLSGFPGTRENSLALFRGDAEAAGFNFDSMRDRLGPGGLRPVAVLPHQVPDDFAFLRDLPTVAGAEGLAVGHARAVGADPEAARTRAAAFDWIYQAGRLVVAPPGMNGDLSACLADHLARIAADPAFVASAERMGRVVSFKHGVAVAEDLARIAPEQDALGVLFRGFVGASGSGSGG